MTEKEVTILWVKMDRALKDIEGIVGKLDDFILSHTKVVESLGNVKEKVEKHAWWITWSTRWLIWSFWLLLIESIFILVKFFLW